MQQQNGLLLVTMEPPPAMEEEFNEWYDSEHVPERAAIPGFHTALRFVCVSGWPRYLALYDLERQDVLDGAAYAAVSGDRFSPWSKRVLQRVRGQCRMAATQTYPGTAITGRLARLLFVRFSGLAADDQDALFDQVRGAFEHQPGVLQLRCFHEATEAGPRYIVLVDGSQPFGPIDVAHALGRFGKHVDIVNEYAPYWTRGPLHGVYAHK